MPSILFVLLLFTWALACLPGLAAALALVPVLYGIRLVVTEYATPQPGDRP